MGATPRTPTPPTQGQRKKASSSRLKAKALVSRAAALMVDKPVLKPKAALRRAGVTSSAAIQRLSKDLQVEVTSRVNKKSKSAARSGPKHPRATTVATQVSAASKDHTRLARSIARDDLRNKEELPHKPTSDAQPVPVAHGSMNLADASTGEALNGADFLAALAALQMHLWTAMFQWSPFGLILKQTAAVAILFGRGERDGSLDGSDTLQEKDS